MKIKTKDIYKKGRYTFLELEQWLLWNDLSKVNGDELMTTLLNDFDLADVIYLMDAYRMPRRQMIGVVSEYDKGKSKFDELAFVRNLANLYNVEDGDVIRRIQEVRIVNREERAQSKGKITISKKAIFYFARGLKT